MNWLNCLICFFRGHENRVYYVTRFEFGFTCLRCGRTIPSCRKVGAL